MKFLFLAIFPLFLGLLPAQAQVTRQIDLNISERRISESDYFAETAIDVQPAQIPNLTIRIGASVRAQEIDLYLRNIEGEGIFQSTFGTSAEEEFENSVLDLR